MGMFFDYPGVRLTGTKAEGKKLALNWRFTDVGEEYVLRLENSALSYAASRQLETADATLTIARATLDNIIAGKLTVPEAVGSGAVAIAGNAGKVVEVVSLLGDLHPMLPIVEPEQR